MFENCLCQKRAEKPGIQSLAETPRVLRHQALLCRHKVITLTEQGEVSACKTKFKKHLVMSEKVVVTLTVLAGFILNADVMVNPGREGKTCIQDFAFKHKKVFVP